MAIRILSLDFDGCLFNSNFINGEKNILNANKKFLSQLKEKNNLYSRSIAIVGSNRQSYQVDLVNQTGAKPSCFPELKKIAAELKCEYDTFLLADIYGDLPAGTSYLRALEPNPENSTHSNWVFDESKVSVLYAQIHKTALENPNEEIEFEFYDDRADILNQLKGFFNKTDLIPKHVRLKLHQYAGGEVKECPEIQGTGFVDAHYKKTVKRMAELATRGKDQYSEAFNFGTFVDPALLNTRTPFVGSQYSFFAKPKDINKVYPDSYKAMWKKESSNTPLQQVMTLLRDYTKEDFFLGSWLGRVFHLHWNRHHVEAIQTIIKQNYTTLEEVYRDLKRINCAEQGSLGRRIQFIETEFAGDIEAQSSIRLVA